MSYVDIGMPVLLLVLAFMLKLLVDRSTTAPVFIESLLELPVDITFLAMSFIVAFTLGSSGKADEGMFTFLVYVVSAIAIVFIWRRSISLFENDKLFWSGSLGVLNYSISITGVVYALNLLKEIVSK
jgi:hypothetical protein